MPSRRDYLEPGYLYRVVERPKGSDDPWVPVVETIYHRFIAARRMRTRHETGSTPRRNAMKGDPEMEFAVQRTPVTEWKVTDEPA